MSSPFGDRPVFHGIRHFVGDSRINRMSLADRSGKRGVCLLGEVIPHHLDAENVLSIYLGYMSVIFSLNHTENHPWPGKCGTEKALSLVYLFIVKDKRNLTVLGHIREKNYAETLTDGNTYMPMESILKTDDIVDLEVTDLSGGGDAVGHYNDLAVFLPFGVPGQRVSAVITEVKKGYASARILKVKDESPHTVDPGCLHFMDCGGCSWLNVAYDRQVGAKLDFIGHHLSVIGSGLPLKPILRVQEPFHYRNRAIYHVGNGPRIGFFRRKSHQVIDIGNCRLVSEPINNAMAQLRRCLLGNESNTARLQESGNRDVNTIILRSNRDGDVIAAFESGSSSLPESVRRCVPAFTGIRGAVWRSSAPTRSGGQYKKTITLCGDPVLPENAGGIRFHLDTDAFFQIHTGILEKMIKFIGKRIAPGDSVVDFYGGMGALSLPFHKQASRILIIDSDSDSSIRFKQTLADNGIGNAGRLVLDLNRSLPETVPPQNCDLAIIDPPRGGIGRELIGILKKRGPGKLIYISCNPMTFIRDLAVLSPEYRPDEIIPADLFPQTPHIEILSSFIRIR